MRKALTYVPRKIWILLHLVVSAVEYDTNALLLCTSRRND